MKTYLKVIVLGDRNSGKTSFCERLANGDFSSDYNPTKTTNISSSTLITKNKGDTVILNLVDTPGGKSCKEIWNGTDAFFVFFDLSNENGDVNKWVKMIRDHYEEKCPPIVLCGSKVDMKCREEKIYTKHIPKTQLFLVSAKSNYNFEKPFLYILREILGKDTMI